MSSITDEQIIKELQLTNRLLANILIMNKGNQKEKILTLYGCGFSQSTIAEVLGIKPTNVTSIVSRSKKAVIKKEGVKKSKASESNDIPGS